MGPRDKKCCCLLLAAAAVEWWWMWKDAAADIDAIAGLCKGGSGKGTNNHNELRTEARHRRQGTGNIPPGQQRRIRDGQQARSRGSSDAVRRGSGPQGPSTRGAKGRGQMEPLHLAMMRAF